LAYLDLHLARKKLAKG